MARSARVFVFKFTNDAIHNENQFSLSHFITSGFGIFTPAWIDNNDFSWQLLAPPLLLTPLRFVPTTLTSPLREYRRFFKKKSFTRDHKEAKYQTTILIRGAHMRGMPGCSTLPSQQKFNPFTPNDHYSGPTSSLNSKSCILYIYSTNTGTEHFEHSIYSSCFSLQNAVFS